MGKIFADEVPKCNIQMQFEKEPKKISQNSEAVLSALLTAKWPYTFE